MITIDLSDLYKSQFGEGGKPLAPDAVPTANGTPIRCPLTLGYNGETYTLPFEPIISIQGRNIVIRNHILKATENGTIKEMWSADDYSIEIKGIVINTDDDNRLPEEAINKIRKFCEIRRAVEVSSPLLTLFGIQYMAIEDYNFPHTNGYSNQAYVIRGYSDKPFELF